MNHDVPETLAAARSRAADLEQQLLSLIHI